AATRPPRCPEAQPPVRLRRTQFERPQRLHLLQRSQRRPTSGGSGRRCARSTPPGRRCRPPRPPRRRTMRGRSSWHCAKRRWLRRQRRRRRLCGRRSSCAMRPCERR
ncbi:unnamed protein product, partial [Phaeothamnion confervicola]